MTLSDLDRKLARYAPIILIVLGALIVLPRLATFGFWDPSEVRVADAARVYLENPHRSNTPVAVGTKIVAAGFSHIGIGEMGGRLPLALVSLLAMLATYYLGRALLRPRAALIGAIALGTMPAFLFGARQLTSAAPGVLALALALGGLARLAWPLADEGAPGLLIAALAAAAGLWGGHATSGLLVGVIAPLAAIGIALALDRKTKAMIVGAGVAALIALAVLQLRKYSAFSAILNGVPRPPQHQTVVSTLLHQLGFSSSPWLALVPFALLHAFDGSQRTREDDGERAGYARLLLPAAFATVYVAATAHFACIADLVVPAGPLVGLLAGAWIDDALDAAESGPVTTARALEGVAIACLAIIFGHDLMLTTDAFVSVQAAEQIRWPQQIYWTGDVLFGFMSIFGLLLCGALALPLAWSGAEQRRLQTKFLLGAVAVQVLFAFAVVQWFIPTASKHLSPKDLYGKTKQLDPKAPLGQYRFNSTGASYFMNGRSATSFNTLDEVLTFLQKPERVFVFVGADELAPIDQAARRGTHPVQPPDGTPPPLTNMVSYVVVDDSNSRFLILSNRLGPGETDLNPLRRLVSDTPPKPKTPINVNFEDKLQLIGYDLPAEVAHGADVPVKLYFKVLAPLGGTYKIFIHFDGPGARINGDHVPLDGKFPTQFWTPGTYVTDDYTIKPDRATEPQGNFQFFFGLFAGDKRLKVKEGPSDGENRVKLGNVRVK